MQFITTTTKPTLFAFHATLLTCVQDFACVYMLCASIGMETGASRTWQKLRALSVASLASTAAASLGEEGSESASKSMASDDEENQEEDAKEEAAAVVNADEQHIPDEQSHEGATVPREETEEEQRATSEDNTHYAYEEQESSHVASSLNERVAAADDEDAADAGDDNGEESVADERTTNDDDGSKEREQKLPEDKKEAATRTCATPRSSRVRTNEAMMQISTHSRRRYHRQNSQYIRTPTCPLADVVSRVMQYSTSQAYTQRLEESRAIRARVANATSTTTTIRRAPRLVRDPQAQRPG
uniref:Uncharacterized protein n=1 Tax=Globisporangium ultimum (strain ATCC 200006 / CBS 805.95 / DAOM BR144) TaxID=431595 RepID=K3X7D0_GLOUD